MKKKLLNCSEVSGVRRGVSGVGGVRGWDIPCICGVPVFPEPLNPEIRLSDAAIPPFAPLSTKALFMVMFLLETE